jgi:hypothetical protein
MSVLNAMAISPLAEPSFPSIDYAIRKAPFEVNFTSAAQFLVGVF